MLLSSRLCFYTDFKTQYLEKLIGFQDLLPWGFLVALLNTEINRMNFVSGKSLLMGFVRYSSRDIDPNASSPTCDEFGIMKENFQLHIVDGTRAQSSTSAKHYMNIFLFQNFRNCWIYS